MKPLLPVQRKERTREPTVDAWGNAIDGEFSKAAGSTVTPFGIGPPALANQYHINGAQVNDRNALLSIAKAREIETIIQAMYGRPSVGIKNGK
jgi:hypothetical protein